MGRKKTRHTLWFVDILAHSRDDVFGARRGSGSGSDCGGSHRHDDSESVKQGFASEYAETRVPYTFCGFVKGTCTCKTQTNVRLLLFFSNPIG